MESPILGGGLSNHGDFIVRTTDVTYEAPYDQPAMTKAIENSRSSYGDCLF